MRPALADEAMRVWPAVKAAHLMATAEEYVAFREAGPWRVRVNDSGEAVVLARWREHSDVVAIRGLWAFARTPDLVEDAAEVARAHGFGRVLSPLVPERRLAAYEAASMSVVERIVAFQGVGNVARARPPPGSRLRAAPLQDDLGSPCSTRRVSTTSGGMAPPSWWKRSSESASSPPRVSTTPP
jgi:hypothetical protein